MFFLLHPTLNCNCICTHCGASKSTFPSESPTLSPDDLLFCIENIIKCFSLDKINHTYVLHGGEPLTLGKKYFEQFINLTVNHKISHNASYSVQTNLTLYNSKWGNLFKKYNISVSTSYDFFTDYRKLKKISIKNSNSYYEVWKEKVMQYQDDTGNKPCVITIVNKENIDHIEEIIELASQLNIHIKLNPLYPAGKAKVIFQNNALTPKEYGDVLIRAYRKWQNYREKMSFAQGEMFENFIFYRKELSCPFKRDCQGVIALYPDGSVYKCGICAQLGTGYLGNALKKTLNIDAFIKMKIALASMPEECMECGICQGGCSINYNIGQLMNSPQRATYCEAYKMLYNEIIQYQSFRPYGRVIVAQQKGSQSPRPDGRGLLREEQGQLVD